MRKILLALALLACRGAHAEEATNPPAFWGNPSIDGGKCCATLAEVRQNIDRIDHAILALMAERGKYVAEAGRFKKDPAAVSAPARVEAISQECGRTRRRKASTRPWRKGRIAR